MEIIIFPQSHLSGTVTAPSSKAQTHRALFAGLLTKGTTTIRNPLDSDDTEATANGITALGAKIVRTPQVWIVNGAGKPTSPNRVIECGESGVTMRFTIPIISLTGSNATLRGRERLLQRPIEPLTSAMEQLGVRLTKGVDFVRITGGPPEGGTVSIRGDISSQFISGLLLAAPLMKKGVKLIITTELESRSYVYLTIQTMNQHQVQIKANEELTRLEVAPDQSYQPTEHKVAGDYSSAAFLLAAAAITNSKLLVRNLQPNSSEPDSALIDCLNKMGIHTSFQADGLQVEGGYLKAHDLDLIDCPDLGPIVAVLGCFADGETRITGAARLRYKESDRLAAISSELNSLGADIKETADGLMIRGPSALNGGVVRSHGDHRITMALAVAALRAKEKVTIEGAESVAKSYPRFYEDMRSLGVKLVG